MLVVNAWYQSQPVCPYLLCAELMLLLVLTSSCNKETPTQSQEYAWIYTIELSSTKLHVLHIVTLTNPYVNIL